MNKIYTILNPVLLVLIILIAISYLVFPIIGADSGFYLSTAREFYSGKSFFVEVSSSYNPLAIVTLGIPFLFSDHPDSRFSLLINFAIIVVAAFFLFKILKTIQKERKTVFFFTFYFILTALILDGSQLMLEPLSVCFQLIGLHYYLSHKSTKKDFLLLLVGFFIALSFLAKQYGLFILLPIGIDVLISKESILKKIFLIGLGLCIPLIVLIIYLYFNGATPLESILYMLGQGVKLDKGNGTGINFTLVTYLMGFVFFGVCNLYLFSIPNLLLHAFTKKKLRYSIYLICLPFSFLVLLAASYSHYFQYVTPYLIIALVYLMSVSDTKKSPFLNTLFTASILIILGVSLFSLSKKPEKLLGQEQAKKVILSNISVQSKVYLDGISPAFYYLCDFKSIDLKKIGFCFPGYFFPKTILNAMPKGSYLIVTKSSFPNYRKIVDLNQVKTIYINHELCYLIQK